MPQVGPTANAMSTDKSIDGTEQGTFSGSAMNSNSIPSTDNMRKLTSQIKNLTDNTPPKLMRPPDAANPQRTNSIAYELQRDGMSSGQSLNQATQAGRSAPFMDKGGSVDIISNRVDNPIGLAAGGIAGYSGGLMALPNFNNSVQMATGGINDNAAQAEAQNEVQDPNPDIQMKPEPAGMAGMASGGTKGLMNKPDDGPPPGATAEEVADDQPTMLSKGELVVPANVVRWHGLKLFMKLRDDALTGLADMELAGQLRRDGDNKNPGDEDETPDMTLMGGKSAYDKAIEQSNGGDLVDTPKDLGNPSQQSYQMAEGGNVGSEYKLALMDKKFPRSGKGKPPNNTTELPAQMPTAYRPSSGALFTPKGKNIN